MAPAAAPLSRIDAAPLLAHRQDSPVPGGKPRQRSHDMVGMDPYAYIGHVCCQESHLDGRRLGGRKGIRAQHRKATLDQFQALKLRSGSGCCPPHPTTTNKPPTPPQANILLLLCRKMRFIRHTSEWSDGGDENELLLPCSQQHDAVPKVLHPSIHAWRGDRFSKGQCENSLCPLFRLLGKIKGQWILARHALPTGSSQAH